MLTAIINATDINSAHQIINSNPNQIDAFEWRLDYLPQIELDAVESCCKASSKPLILTLRRKQDGGLYDDDEAQRIALLKQLARCRPHYLDIEADVDHSVLKECAQYCSIIRSHHDFAQTPADLPQLLDSLKHPDAALIKLVTQAHSTLDSLRMLSLIKQEPPNTVIAHCMGEDGLISRFLGPVIGSAISYTQLDANAVLAHLPTLDDYQLHRFYQLNTNTEIYGLIGDPVSHSDGARFHNHYFQQTQRNAVYVKLRIEAEQLPSFFDYCHTLNIKGLSVTMPLKKDVIAFIDSIPDGCDAINTIGFNDASSAINTDGEGAVRALQQHTTVLNKKVLVIGAGGSATGIIACLEQHTKHINIYNRTHSKAQQLAKQYHATALLDTQAQQQTFDIIINTLPPQAQQQNATLKAIINHQSASTVIMDIVYKPSNTPVIELARKIGASCVYGKEMFEQQALLQQHYWQQHT